MLKDVAREIKNTSTSWVLLGAEIGLKKEVLDRIEVDSRQRNELEEHATYNMLWRARECGLLSTPAQLVRACQGKESIHLAWKLTKMFGMPHLPPETFSVT